MNCSTIDTTFNDTMPDLQCYEFVFDVSETLSDAGGILATGVVVFTLIVTIVLFLSKGEDGCKCIRRCCGALFTQAFMSALIFGLLIAAFLLTSLMIR